MYAVYICMLICIMRRQPQCMITGRQRTLIIVNEPLCAGPVPSFAPGLRHLDLSCNRLNGTLQACIVYIH